MEFSEEWMSLWTVSSVYSPPNLIVSSREEEEEEEDEASWKKSLLLGPLVFAPSPTKFPKLVVSALFPPLKSLPSNKNKNVLEILRCSLGGFLLFFPAGTGTGTGAAGSDDDDYSLNQLGFVKLENGLVVISGESKTTIYDHQFESGIQRISGSTAIQAAAAAAECGNYYFLLMVSTLFSLHWYRVEAASGSAAYLGSHRFSHPIRHVCWSPHLPHECLVLLEFGDLLLFDLVAVVEQQQQQQLNNLKFPAALSTKGSKFVFNDPNKTRFEWLGCDFSWHPRIFLVASSSSVFLVDWRLDEADDTKVTLLATTTTTTTTTHNNKRQSNSFSAFCLAGSDGFHFTLASPTHLFLVDMRKPLTPLLQWAHNLDNPQYMNVLKLSDLRSKSKDIDIDMYEWASNSGFAILLGSYFDLKFNLFCYGPPLPPPDGSVSCQISKLCNSIYAWELPSEFSMLLGRGGGCSCGNCLLSHDSSKEWKDERILGFGIISEDLDSDGLSSAGGGFTLIRLVSSGMLVSQKYIANWDFSTSCSSSSKADEDSPDLDLFTEHKYYKFPRRFRYLKLDSLVGFMDAKIQNPSQPSSSSSRVIMAREHVGDNILSAAGVGVVSPPSVLSVLNGISWPMSVHEVTSTRMWGSFNMEELLLLQLAFTDDDNNNQQKGRRRRPPPPPVLPLPYLLTLAQVNNKEIEKGKAADCSAAAKMRQECNKVMQLVASEPGKESESLLFYKPGPPHAHEDDRFDTMICNRTRHKCRKQVDDGLELLDDMCPIELKFDVAPAAAASASASGVSFLLGTEELNGYRVLKREFSRWLDSIKEPTT